VSTSMFPSWKVLADPVDDACRASRASRERNTILHSPCGAVGGLIHKILLILYMRARERRVNDFLPGDRQENKLRFP
jgi:hypothetical protein